MTPTTRQLDVNGLRYHLDEYDGGGRTTVLLLHGFLDLGRAWRATVAALPPNDWHIVAPDWRGHGRSGHVGAGGYYHFADYVRDLDTVARAVRRDRLFVVGHSMGAMVGSLWLGARPDAAQAFVMVEGLGPPAIAVDGYPQRFAQWLDETSPFDPARFIRPMRDAEHAARRLRRLHPKATDEHLAELVAEATVTDEDGVRWRYDPLHRTRSPAPMMPAVAASFWRNIAVPTLWVGGAESQWLGPGLDQRLTDIPHLRRQVLPEAGHMVHTDAPQSLAEAIFAFLSGLG